MNAFLPTFIITLILVSGAIALLAIGWLVTGRSRIVRGSCGLDPNKLRDEECGHCDLCGGSEKEPEEPEEPEESEEPEIEE